MDARSLVAYEKVSCRLPLSPRHPRSTQPQYMWTVSIANNNESYSNDESLFVFDSKCLDCPDNTVATCVQKVKQCAFV